MKQLTLFRILTYTLLPIAVIFGFFDFLVILSALANPALLLVAFVLAAFVIYTFKSLVFLTKSINTGRHQHSNLRDWIRVNAYVSLFMGMLMLMNGLSVLFSSDMVLRQYLNQFLETQPNIPPQLTIDLFLTLLKGMVYFMLFVSIILLSHIFLNFRIMRQYSYLFDIPSKD